MQGAPNHTRVDLDMAENDIPSEEMPIKARHDVGGKVSIPLPSHVEGTAVFGGIADQYRYRLSRTWAEGSRVLFVMMQLLIRT